MRVVLGVIDHDHSIEKAIVWCSYRHSIPGIGSDAGWGCMIRCAQMLQAQVLHRLAEGPSWRDKPPCKIIKRQFLDNDESRFSIQHFLATALGQNIRVGHWLTPHTACLITRDVLHDRVRAVVCTDRVIVKQELPQSGSCLILIPMRLGPGKHPFPDHKKDVMKYIQIPYFSGILGGTPRHALYIVGYELVSGDKVMLAVDPHKVHAVDVDLPVPTLSRVAFQDLDPCMAVTFFCPDRNSRDDLLFHLTLDPLVEITDGRPSAVDSCEAYDGEI